MKKDLIAGRPGITGHMVRRTHARRTGRR